MAVSTVRRKRGWWRMAIWAQSCVLAGLLEKASERDRERERLLSETERIGWQRACTSYAEPKCFASHSVAIRWRGGSVCFGPRKQAAGRASLFLLQVARRLQRRRESSRGRNRVDRSRRRGQGQLKELHEILNGQEPKVSSEKAS